MAASAFTKEVFGLTSVQAIIDSLVEFLVNETKKFRLVHASSGKSIIVATHRIDSTIPIAVSNRDMLWGLSFVLGSQGGQDPARNDQLCIGWGNMSLFADPVYSEITINDPITFEKQAIMTGAQQGGGLGGPARQTFPPSSSNPHGYRATVTSRGVTICIFAENSPVGWSYAGIFSLQRLVNPDGSPYLSGKSPIFVLWNNMDSAPGEFATLDYDGINRGGTNSGTGDLRWFTSVLRESDRFTASQSSVPDPLPFVPSRGLRPSENKAWNINQVHFENRATLRGFPTTWIQPILKDNREIAFIFPYGFTTSRFSYTKEMDMICACSAQAVTFGQVVDVTAFGQERKYQMMVPSQSLGTGLTIGILIDGPEFS